MEWKLADHGIDPGMFPLIHYCLTLLSDETVLVPGGTERTYEKLKEWDGGSAKGK